MTRRKNRQPRPGVCNECGRTVAADRPVSHVLRGNHTCTDADGLIPPYLDPETPAEEAAHEAYLATRLTPSNPS